jgi:hypothetical protein
MSDSIDGKGYKTRDYVAKRRKLKGFFFESALPNEYLVQLGKKGAKPVLGGKRFRWFRKFMRVPASVQTLYFQTDNANLDWQGIGIMGYASWRINPNDLDVAFSAMDFFDEDDPMARTTEQLKTICVEAVRHVIANMSIEDAVRKKDEIAENLLDQLKEMEKRWGILFDHVGIEQVRIMSKSVFENLQADYRNSLRLQVEKKRIDTDRQVASEENSLREKTERERIDTDRELGLAKVDNDARVTGAQLEERHKLKLKEAGQTEEQWKRDAAFRDEKATREHELAMAENRREAESWREEARLREERIAKEHEIAAREKTLESELRRIEEGLLEARRRVADVQAGIDRVQIGVDRERRAADNEYTPEALQAMLLERLPDIYGALKIDDYSVLATGDNASPLSRVFAEVLALLKQAGVSLPGTRPE